VLSQLSYNPTIGPLIGADIGRHPGRVTGCSAGEIEAPPIAGLHHPGSLRIVADACCSRVIAFGREYSAGSEASSLRGPDFGISSAPMQPRRPVTNALIGR
jgi:hypothetical protein